MIAKDELLQIHDMVMCPAEVNSKTPADGYTANAVKQLILFYLGSKHDKKQVDDG